jgi:hypothetical protein
VGDEPRRPLRRALLARLDPDAHDAVRFRHGYLLRVTTNVAGMGNVIDMKTRQIEHKCIHY